MLAQPSLRMGHLDAVMAFHTEFLVAVTGYTDILEPLLLGDLAVLWGPGRRVREDGLLVTIKTEVPRPVAAGTDDLLDVVIDRRGRGAEALREAR